MSTNFFTQLHDLLNDQTQINLVIKKTDDKLIILTELKTCNKTINEHELNVVNTASPEEFDKEYLSLLTQPIESIERGLRKFKDIEEELQLKVVAKTKEIQAQKPEKAQQLLEQNQQNLFS